MASLLHLHLQLECKGSQVKIIAQLYDISSFILFILTEKHRELVLIIFYVISPFQNAHWLEAGLHMCQVMVDGVDFSTFTKHHGNGKCVP